MLEPAFAGLGLVADLAEALVRQRVGDEHDHGKDRGGRGHQPEDDLDRGQCGSGLLGGGAAGTVLNGGLRNLLQDMEDNGQGGAAKSWVGTGENQSIAPNDLARAIGADDIDAVARETGMSQADLLSQLSQHLPDFVDRLTPDGRLPNDEEASRW